MVATARETAGEMVEVEAICKPGPPGVAERSFARHQVRFEVLEGCLLVEVEGEPRLLTVGEALCLEAGVAHRISTPSDRRAARFIWQMRPAPEATNLAELIFGGAQIHATNTTTGPTAQQEGDPHV